MTTFQEAQIKDNFLTVLVEFFFLLVQNQNIGTFLHARNYKNNQ